MTISSICCNFCCCFTKPETQQETDSLENAHKILEKAVGRTDSSILESARREREKAFKTFAAEDFQKILQYKISNPVIVKEEEK